MKMLSATLLLAGLSAALASCPNDCSGHGTCNTYSACVCMRNWMGADCSERVCMFSRSYIDTPQGDLNADGFVDKSTVKTVILGATSSFWNEDDGSVCDGTDCTSIGSAAKYTTSTTFKTFFSDSTPVSSTSTGAGAADTTFIGGLDFAADTNSAQDDYLVAECDTTKTIVRKITAMASGATLTIATLANDPLGCGADSAAARFTGVGTAYTAATSTLASAIYPADEFTVTNDPYNFVADCDELYTADGADITHAIKVEVASLATPAAYTEALMVVPTFTPDAVDRTGATKVNPLTDIAEDGAVGIAMRVCAVSGTTYATQWSPKKEWELYPDEHGESMPSSATKAKYDEAHFFKECAGKGKCDRSTGECECYAGWEGTGCIRAACSEGCSGHGFCKRIADVTDTYLGWDNYNSQYCVCEPGYEGADCSLRTCPKGHDPIHRGLLDEVQTITLAQNNHLTAPGTDGSDASMALVFVDEFGDEWVTGSFVIKPMGVTATATASSTDCTDYKVAGAATWTITNGGSQYDPASPPAIALTGCTTTTSCADCVVVDQHGVVTGVGKSSSTALSSIGGTLTSATAAVIDAPPAPETYKSYFYGAANMARALENLPNNVVPAVTINVDTGTAGDTAITSTGTVAFRITFTDNSGDIPQLGARFGNSVVRGAAAADGALPSADGPATAWFYNGASRWSCNHGHSGASTTAAEANTCNAWQQAYGWVPGLLTIAESTKGTKINNVCSDRGICDYSTGECKCFPGYTDVDCHVQNALSMG